MRVTWVGPRGGLTRAERYPSRVEAEPRSTRCRAHDAAVCVGFLGWAGPSCGEAFAIGHPYSFLCHASTSGRQHTL
jgi:hypothetical protein